MFPIVRSDCTIAWYVLYAKGANQSTSEQEYINIRFLQKVQNIFWAGQWRPFKSCKTMIDKFLSPLSQ